MLHNRTLVARILLLCAALSSSFISLNSALAQPKVADGAPRPMELIRGEASRIVYELQTEGAKRFLIAASWLPIIDERVVYWNKADRKAATPDEFAKLAPEAQKNFQERKLDEGFYYYTRYGSPVAYSRALDLLASEVERTATAEEKAPKPPLDPTFPGAQPRKFNAFEGKKILDFGFGGIGHLRLLASIGADVTGVDVDDLLKAYYNDPKDQGSVKGAPIGGQPGSDGSLKLVFGQWPADKKTADGVGEGYDIIISKNTLKNGYINPEHQVDERMLIKLGVSNDDFVAHLNRILKPGGKILIYNLCPAQKPEPKDYIPWADGRCPFPREMLEKHGLRVVEFDKQDDDWARKLGKAIGWDKDGMNLEKDLFAWYTLIEKPANPSTPKASQ